MNPYRLIEFFKSGAGKLAGFIALVSFALILAHGCRNESAPATVSSKETNAPLVQSVRHVVSPITPVKSTASTNATNRADIPALPPLTVYGELGAEPDSGGPSAPFGSMIPCRLVQTVESSGDNETPIIALTTADLAHLGQIVVPRHSEVHGRAKARRFRDRVHSESSWTIVWLSGEEMTVSGIALDQDRLPSGGWGATDGSSGLRGQLIRSDHWDELKLFAAAFLSGAAQTVEERPLTAFGAQVLPQAQNAALQGTSEVLNRYAAQVTDRLEREAFMVRVPSGKPFYLYVTQPIERAKARRGITRSASVPVSTTSQKSIP